MVQKLRQLVLLLILGMVVFSPFMQLDSWDAFPVATGDLELHLIGTFCVIGMFLVFVGIMKLCPELLCSSFTAPPLMFFAFATSTESAESVTLQVYSPLRI
jgi:hypothetical protein